MEKYVKKSKYFKKLSNKEKEHKVRVLENLLDGEGIYVSQRKEIIKKYYHTHVFSNSKNIHKKYRLLDMVLMEEKWIITPKELINAMEDCDFFEGKNFKVYLSFEKGELKYGETYYESKYFSPERVAGQLM